MSSFQYVWWLLEQEYQRHVFLGSVTGVFNHSGSSWKTTTVMKRTTTLTDRILLKVLPVTSNVQLSFSSHSAGILDDVWRFDRNFAMYRPSLSDVSVFPMRIRVASSYLLRLMARKMSRTNCQLGRSEHTTTTTSCMLASARCTEASMPMILLCFFVRYSRTLSHVSGLCIARRDTIGTYLASMKSSLNSSIDESNLCLCQHTRHNTRHMYQDTTCKLIPDDHVIRLNTRQTHDQLCRQSVVTDAPTYTKCTG